MRITVACPDTFRSDANNLAMVLAFGPPDELTYEALNWQDADDNLYAAASFEVSPEWIGAAQLPLVHPAWDTANIIDMDAAGRAQEALVLWNGEEDVPQAIPAALTAVAGMEGLAALAAMGLVRVESKE